MIKQSVSIAIWDDAGRVLLVQRPEDDEDLPNSWGLPAASLKAGESWEDAAARAGREKLGVDVQVVRELEHGRTERPDYTLEMKLFEATMRGAPNVAQSTAGVTQYQSWKWGIAADLEPASERGSLCCRLFLEHTGKV